MEPAHMPLHLRGLFCPVCCPCCAPAAATGTEPSPNAGSAVLESACVTADQSSKHCQGEM